MAISTQRRLHLEEGAIVALLIAHKRVGGTKQTVIDRHLEGVAVAEAYSELHKAGYIKHPVNQDEEPVRTLWILTTAGAEKFEEDRDHLTRLMRRERWNLPKSLDTASEDHQQTARELWDRRCDSLQAALDGVIRSTAEPASEPDAILDEDEDDDAMDLDDQPDDQTDDDEDEDDDDDEDDDLTEPEPVTAKKATAKKAEAKKAEAKKKPKGRQSRPSGRNPRRSA